MTTNIQLGALRKLDDDVMTPALTKEEATVFSVYLGEPGDYTCIGDFGTPDEAEYLALVLRRKQPEWKIDREQFDSVMNPPPPAEPEVQPEGRLQWAIVAGNPVEGFALYGPYKDRDDAVSAAENGRLGGDWWIAELEPTGALVDKFVDNFIEGPQE